MRRQLLCLFFLLTSYLLPLTTAFATAREEVHVSATVPSFGGYTFTQEVDLPVAGPENSQAGTIVVDGLYNGEYPWILRVYTDNLHFSGVAGALNRPKPGGLISTDGRFSIPLEIHSPTFGPEVWRRVPDLNESDYISYQPSPEPVDLPVYTDCILFGIDPRNAAWVAGRDGLLYTADDNVLGDLTIRVPFEIFLRAEVSAQSVQGEYEAVLYFEIVPAP